MTKRELRNDYILKACAVICFTVFCIFCIFGIAIIWIAYLRSIRSWESGHTTAIVILAAVLILSTVLIVFMDVECILRSLCSNSIHSGDRYVTVDKMTGKIVDNDINKEIRYFSKVRRIGLRYSLKCIPDIHKDIPLVNSRYSRIKLVLSIDDVQKYVDNSKKDEYEQKRQSELLNEVINKTAKNNVSEFESDLEQNLSGTGLSIKRCEFIEIEPYINCNTGE